jgi:hypothetical protein
MLCLVIRVHLHERVSKPIAAYDSVDAALDCISRCIIESAKAADKADEGNAVAWNAVAYTIAFVAAPELQGPELQGGR